MPARSARHRKGTESATVSTHFSLVTRLDSTKAWLPWYSLPMPQKPSAIQEPETPRDTGTFRAHTSQVSSPMLPSTLPCMADGLFTTQAGQAKKHYALHTKALHSELGTQAGMKECTI